MACYLLYVTYFIDLWYNEYEKEDVREIRPQLIAPYKTVAYIWILKKITELG